MKKRIFTMLTLFIVIVTTLSMFFSVAFYYNFYKSNIKTEIKSETYLISEYVKTSDVKNIVSTKISDARITLVKSDGSVIYDSVSDGNLLENHLGRYEIATALENGFGEAIRYSDTLKADTYYFALRLSNGNVLRLSRCVDSIYNMFSKTFPFLIFINIIIILFALAFSKKITKKIFRPIGKNIDDILSDKPIENIDEYEELNPFVFKLRGLNRDLREHIKKLKNERDTINTITHNMKEGIILLDRNQNILSINKSAKKMLDINFNIDYINKNILLASRNNDLHTHILKILEEKTPRKFIYTTQSNEHLRFYISTAENGSVAYGVLILILNVTKEIMAETIRKDFSANVSHELKTPLTSIKGFAEMIENGMISSEEDIKKSAGLICKESNRLLLLINDIIRISQIEDENEPLAFENVDLKSVFESVIESVMHLADKQNVSISLEAENASILANKAIIEELIYNVLDNAVKYNKPNGKVEVKLTQSQNDVTFCVRDTGIGISKEHQERIFERFYRVDKSRSKETGGTGLGLSIVKHATQYHNGKLKLESQKDIGTTITIVLPKEQIK